MAWDTYRNKSAKYNNKSIVVNDIEFDSKKEAKRYQELLLLEKAGAITDLELQVKYVLIPAQYEPDVIGPRGSRKQGRLIERECSYIADFQYYENGNLIVEDVKGFKDPSSAGYAKFVIKRKLMLFKYGIRIREV